MIFIALSLNNKAEIDGLAVAIAKARVGCHLTRVAILSAHINELRFYYQCAVPLGACFLSVTFDISSRLRFVEDSDMFFQKHGAFQKESDTINTVLS